MIGYEKVCAVNWVARVFTTSVFVSAMSATSAADVVRFRGDAYDLKTGAFIYSENHSAFHKNGKHTYSRVSYRDKSGHEFASKLISFEASQTQPSYELNDVRDGYQEGIKREGGVTVYYARRKRNSEVKTKRILTPQPAVFDAGFDYYVRENFDQLCAGQRKTFFFGVPVELDFFKFRASRRAIGDSCHLYLELDNFFLRQIVKPIKLWYDVATRRLLKYEGISNINGPDGKSIYVRVVFTYPEKP